MFDPLLWLRRAIPGAILAAVLVGACSNDPEPGEGDPDAASMLDGGSMDGGLDAAAGDMDGAPADGGGLPDDADVPMDDAADDAGDAPHDGSTEPIPPGPCVRWERDVDADGEVDTAIAFFYDAEDRLVIEEHDMGSAAGLFDGADGTPDYRQTTRYDDDNHVTSLADDWDADGNDDLITRYDAGGQKTEEAWDVGDDGSIIDRTTYAYREDGELATQTRDRNGDGDADSATAYEYDGDGKLLRIEEDQDLSDELIDKVTTFEYDDGGRRTLEEVYEAEMPASRTVWTYDGDGNLIRREDDEGIDAVVDAIEQWTFDSGVLASHELDDDGDGLVDERQTFDAAGRVVTDEGYHDGVLAVSTAYEYDAEGNVLVERARDGDATLLSVKQYAYDASSRPTQLSVDADGDGIDDLVTRWSYDAEGRLLSVEERRSVDPNDPFVVTEGYRYDGEGRLLEITFDSDADGTPDGFERRIYEC